MPAMLCHNYLTGGSYVRAFCSQHLSLLRLSLYRNFAAPCLLWGRQRLQALDAVVTLTHSLLACLCVIAPSSSRLVQSRAHLLEPSQRLPCIQPPALQVTLQHCRPAAPPLPAGVHNLPAAPGLLPAQYPLQGLLQQCCCWLSHSRCCWTRARAWTLPAWQPSSRPSAALRCMGSPGQRWAIWVWSTGCSGALHYAGPGLLAVPCSCSAVNSDHGAALRDVPLVLRS